MLTTRERIIPTACAALAIMGLMALFSAIDARNKAETLRAVHEATRPASERPMGHPGPMETEAFNAGFLHAWENKPMKRYNTDPVLQAAYLEGWDQGKAELTLNLKSQKGE